MLDCWCCACAIKIDMPRLLIDLAGLWNLAHGLDDYL
jgi:hypothetical protein